MLQVSLSLSASPKISLTGCKSRSYTENISVIVSHTLTAKIGPRNNSTRQWSNHGWLADSKEQADSNDWTACGCEYNTDILLRASDFVFKLNKDHAHFPTALAQRRQRYVLPRDTPTETTV